jgi:tetratricopeptide (TPR) repeat protein
MMRTPSVCCAALLALFTAAPLPAAEKGGRYALLVGVRQYDRSQLTPLSYTENDVTVLAEVFKAGGYRRVVLLTQSRGAFEARYLPTAANVRRELKGLLEDRRDDDMVVVAFCGHGVQFAGSDEPYFCPMDARLTDKKTLISLSEVYSELKECKARVKLLLSDACRNDPLPRATRGDLGPRVFAPTKAERKKPPENVIALFSCSAGEAAYESKDLQHGVFFHYLIQGLRGKATLKGGKTVLLGTLTDYVQREVSDFVKEEVGADVRQRPELVGRYSDSVPLLEVSPASRADPRLVKELIDRGLKHLETNEYRKVIDVTNRALKISGDSALALAMRAHALDYLGDHDKALVDANKALDLDPNMAAAYFTRGNIYLHQKAPARAVTEYTKALERNPRHLLARYNRGRANVRLKYHTRAIRDFTEALRLNPRYAHAYHARGLSHGARKDPDAALADFTRAIEVDPKHASAYADRGLIHAIKGDDSAALADYNQAIRLNSKLTLAYNLRGSVHARRQDNAKALADFTEAIRRQPSFVPALYNRGLIFFKKKDYRTALVDLNEALRHDDKHARAYNLRGVTWSWLGKMELAVADYTRAIKVDSSDPLFYRNRAKAYKKLGQKQKAADDLAMAKKLNAARPKGNGKQRGPNAQ